MTDRLEYIVVARFGRPRGVSGEINLFVISDNPERFHDGGTFWIEAEDGWKEIKVTSFKFFSGKASAIVEGFDTPEKSGRLTNRYLHIKESELGILPEGSYYHFDLIGCRVVDMSGVELGTVTDIEEYPANDIWVVESTKGRRNMFPAVKHFIKEIDINRKLIVLSPPEGIFDSPDEA